MRRVLLLILVVLVMPTARAIAAEPETIADIQQVVATIASSADRHDWKRVRAALADRITTDYTSLFGGKAVTQSAEELVKAWAGFLPGFDATHHMVASVIVTQVDGDRATAQANFTATHRIGSALWVLGGRYDYVLSKTTGGWRVTSLTMAVVWETGDRGLVQAAAKRAAARK